MKAARRLSLAIGLVVSTLCAAAFAQVAPTIADEEVDDDGAAYAPGPPPALPYESPTAAPFAGALWTSGYWRYDGAQWRFESGEWIAPIEGYSFVNGYWRAESGAWRFVPGGFARAGSPDVEVPVTQLAVQVAPPPLQYERPPRAPAFGFVWTSGYWSWSGRHWRWLSGSWRAPPRVGYAWVSPAWHRSGARWTFATGGWAHGGTRRVVMPVVERSRPHHDRERSRQAVRAQNSWYPRPHEQSARVVPVRRPAPVQASRGERHPDRNRRSNNEWERGSRQRPNPR